MLTGAAHGDLADGHGHQNLDQKAGQQLIATDKGQALQYGAERSVRSSTPYVKRSVKDGQFLTGIKENMTFWALGLAPDWTGMAPRVQHQR